MAVTTYVTGAKELQRALKGLSQGAVNRISRPAIRKAASYAAKQVKASVPTRYKGVRKAIGWRNLKTKYNSGIAGAKIGAGVGKRKTTVKQRDGRPGVGFDARNIHWWFLGTNDRVTGTKRARRGGKRGRGGWKGREVRIDTGKVKRRTGRMPAQSQPIHVLLSRSSSELKGIIRTWVAVGIKKESERLRK